MIAEILILWYYIIWLKELLAVEFMATNALLNS